MEVWKDRVRVKFYLNNKIVSPQEFVASENPLEVKQTSSTTTGSKLITAEGSEMYCYEWASKSKANFCALLCNRVMKSKHRPNP